MTESPAEYRTGTDNASEAMEMLIIANFDYAGTDKFISHAKIDGAKKTLCGLFMSERRGQWEFLDIKEPSCKRCKRAIESRNRVI